MAEKRYYSKAVWLKRDTEMLLAEAKAKYIMNNKREKPTDDNVIKEALQVYTNGYWKVKK